MKIIINTKHCYLRPIRNCLWMVQNKFGFELEDSDSVPRYSIWIDGEPVGFVAYRDGTNISKWALRDIPKFDYKVIFKYHYSPTRDYGKYKDKIVASGLYGWLKDMDSTLSRKNLLYRDRPIDIIARMRTTQYRDPNTYRKTWSKDRVNIVAAARKLGKEGYNTRTNGKTSLDKYSKELLDTKIGFSWRGTAYLCWHIPELIQHGVVMIINPLGKDHPIRDDITLEDGVHCVFCNDSTKIAEQAKKLLEDPVKLERIRKNVVDLWFDKLCPEKMGEWYYKKLIAAL